MRSLGLLLPLLLLGACGEKKKEADGVPSEAKSVTTEAKAPANKDRGALATALLQAWVKAQNDGTFDAYVALYDGAFKGIRRTGDGGEKSFDLAGWKADREKLFKNKQTVAADDVKAKIDGDRISLTFIQRWRGGKFADHGEKELVLEPRGAGLKIVREELKWSERGWDDTKTKPFDATSLTSPITMTVERVRGPDNGDCSNTALRITLSDAKGTRLSFEHGSITGGGGAATDKGGKLAPTGREYTYPGAYCAGLQQGYVLKISGETIVAIATWLDEESGPGKESRVVAKLPAGAKVVTK
jgi:hypothetical protein